MPRRCCHPPLGSPWFAAYAARTTCDQRQADRLRIVLAARDLARVATVETLEGLGVLALGPTHRDGLPGVPVDDLAAAGLVVAACDGLVALSTRGRDVWMAVRGLVQ